MRCSINISYNGRDFFGSQSQKDTQNTIFGVFQKVLFSLGIKERAIASGRTDKGVHAFEQVCHLDLPIFWTNLESLKIRLNEGLPKSICVKNIKQVDSNFHARYSAKRRVYRYIIKKSKSNPFEDNFVSFIEDFDIDLVKKNIKLFIGTYDFKFFMKNGSDINSTQRTIYKAFLYEYKGFIILNFEANGFLRSQIRLMVEALFKFDEKKITEQLNCTKKYNLKPAKSNGLYLAKVKY